MTAGMATLGLLAALWWASRRGPLVVVIVLVLGVMILGSLVDPIRDFGLAAINLIQAVVAAIESALQGNL